MLIAQKIVIHLGYEFTKNKEIHNMSNKYEFIQPHILVKCIYNYHLINSLQGNTNET